MSRWLKPKFWVLYVSDIARREVMTFFDGLTKKKSCFGKRHLTHKFIKNLHTLLYELFDDAIERSLAANNPADMVSIEGGEDSLERAVPSREGVTKTFERLPATYQVLFASGADTGLRRGPLAVRHAPWSAASNRTKLRGRVAYSSGNAVPCLRFNGVTKTCEDTLRIRGSKARTMTKIGHSMEDAGPPSKRL